MAERELNRELAGRGGIDASGAFSIAELAELGRSARFAVTNDSGPMHVLAAARIPVFGLFGPSNWRRNHALGQAQRVIACVDFDPDFVGADYGDCLSAISVDTVWSRLVSEELVGR
jgi:ADP-heptose:LPS heptosyltransferase